MVMVMAAWLAVVWLISIPIVQYDSSNTLMHKMKATIANQKLNQQTINIKLLHEVLGMGNNEPFVQCL